MCIHYFYFNKYFLLKNLKLFVVHELQNHKILNNNKSV